MLVDLELPSLCAPSDSATTYFSIAHCIVEYAITNGTAQYKICARVRRKVLKMAAFAVPAKGFCRFALKP